MSQDRHCHVSLWSTAEAGIGIIAGSLPDLRKFVKRWITVDSKLANTRHPNHTGDRMGWESLVISEPQATLKGST